MDVRKEELVERIINSIQTLGVNAEIKANKEKEILKFVPLYNKEYYESKVLLEIKDFTNFMPCLEVVQTKDQLDLWSYFKIATSSIATSKNPGRNVRFLVKDTVSNKYIGILALGSDIYKYTARDTYIGWNADDDQRRNTIYNIWCCVGLQPLAFNYNIGKLLCSLCFSKEVLHILESMYGSKVSTITTFGINGKSIQYEKLKSIKLIGFTKGYGTCHLSDELLEEATSILQADGISIKGKKFSKWKRVFKLLDIPTDLLQHNKRRGVYLGYTSMSSQSFLTGKNEEQDLDYRLTDTVHNIAKWWIQTNAQKRYLHLQTTNRLKDSIVPEWTCAINHTAYDNTIQINEEYIRTIPEVSDAYIAGIIDGDGCITYSKAVKSPSIQLTQCDPQIVIALQRRFNGNICIKKPKRNGRKQFSLSIFHCKSLYEICAKHCIIKQRRAQLGLLLYDKFVENSFDTTLDDMQNLIAQFSESCKVYEPVSPSIYDERMCPEYIAGLFDAEGSLGIRMYKGVTITITQKQCPNILHAINNYINGSGSISKIRLSYYSKVNCKYFIDVIKDHLVIKQDQITEYLNNTCNCHISKQIVNTVELMKRKNYIYVDSLFKDLNIKHKQLKRASRMFKGGVKERQTRICGPQKIDHTVNLVVAKLRKSQRQSIDDEIILVKELLAQGKSQQYIMQELKMPRHKVYGIASNKILPTHIGVQVVRDKILSARDVKQYRCDLSEEDKKRYDIERSAISKRGYTRFQCIDLLKYIASNANTILMSRIYCYNNSFFTKEQVLNIIHGETQLYRREFENDREYSDYLILLQEVMNINWKDVMCRDRSISIRKLSPTMIIDVLRSKYSNKSLTNKEIANNLSLTEDAVRGVLRGSTRIFESEFPINDMSFESYTMMIQSLKKK